MNGQRTPASALKKSAARVPVRAVSKTPGPSRVQSRLSLSKSKVAGSINENTHNNATQYKAETRVQTPGRVLKAPRDEFEVCPVSLNSILTSETETDLNTRMSMYNAWRTTIASRQSILASGGARRVILKKNSRIPSSAVSSNPRTPSRATLAVTDPIWKAALTKSIEYIESTTPRKVNTPSRVTDHGSRLLSPLVELKAEGLKKRLAFTDETTEPSKQELESNTTANTIIKDIVMPQTVSNNSDESLSDQIHRQLEKVRQERALLEERIKALNNRESDLLQQLERAEMLRDLM